MQRERFAQIKELFEAISDLGEPERSRRLHALTDDPELIAEVESLLDRTEHDVARFALPALEALAAVAGDQLNIGDQLGVWTLTGELGHGGMGTVFKAQRHDGHFEQVAAIKLQRGLPSSEALARLAQERQILARLAHPNIARLLDGGATPSGQPYLVMEYVEGEPIDRYCRRLQLSIPQVLRLLIDVADSIGFAHQRLIVHCDLKPGNILVNADGRPLLLDFGIASLMGEEAQWQQPASANAASRAYTPGYASPEQRAGAGVSTATDIYGLGRVLENLLRAVQSPQRSAATGEDADADAMAGTAAAGIPAPLRAIVQHATADDPTQRYVSAGAFADDLRRYLDRQPVLAMGGSRLYRLGCHVRRNALALSLGVLALLALLAGLLSTSLSLRDARQQRQQAQIAGARAERTAAFLGNLLQAVDPDLARDFDTRLLRVLLDDAARNAEAQLANEPLVLSEISSIIGHAYYQLSEYDLSRTHLQRALELLPQQQLRQRLRLREKIADTMSSLRQDRQALADYQAIHDERVRAFGVDDPDSLKSAYALAYQAVNSGDYQHAAAASTALQPRLERVLGNDDQTTLDNLQNMAVARTELGEFDAAEGIFKRLVQRHTQAKGALHSKTIAVQTSLAIFYLRQGRFGDAEQLLRALLPTVVERYGRRSFATINLSSLFGSALRLGGKLEESGQYYRLALDGALEMWGETSTRTLNYALNYANFEVANGEPQPALQRLDDIEPTLIETMGAEHPSIGELHRTRARALMALKRNLEARAAWQRALDLDRKVFGSDTHPQVMEDLAAIAALSKE